MRCYIGPHRDDFSQDVSIEIDNYDLYNLDGTLAKIIYPALLKFRDNVNAYHIVDKEDLPDEIAMVDSDEEEASLNNWCWVLDQMIYSFEKIASDSPWEDQFYNTDKLSPEELAELESDLAFSSWSTFNKIPIDFDGIRETEDKIKNGLRLFGKYFQALWT
jgi:hypothetical protein